MKRVIIESPYAGDVEANLAYARRCMKDSIDRGEAPLASHLLYTQVLDDNDPKQRDLGIMLGLAWATDAVTTVIYCDRGLSRGMALAIERAASRRTPMEFRWLDENGGSK